MRDLLAAVLSLEGFPIATVADGDAFLREAGEQTPVCLFLDIVMRGHSGIDVLKELNARRYAAPIILISARDEGPTIVEAFRSGARDFLAKPFDPYAAVQRVRDAVELWNSRDERRSLAEGNAAAFPGHVRLTRRELEVLAQIVRGVSSKGIGTALEIGKRTVDNIRMSMMRKLGARNAADLVRTAMS